MGIFDFLSDLSKARTKDELGLGGMRSLLGTRGAAPDSKRGEEMMRRTSTDNLPGYFDPETREYVPWYVDLFDGGGLNKSEGLLANDAQKTPSAVDMLKTNGAPVQRASQMAPGPLEPFGGAGPNIPEGPLGPFGGAGPRIANGDPRNLGGSEGYGQTGVSPLDPFGGAGPRIAPQQAPAPAQGRQIIPASGGDMAINTPAAQSRDQMIADQQMYSEEQAMRSHPLYPEYVDFLNRSKMPSTPSLFQKYINTFGSM